MVLGLLAWLKIKVAVLVYYVGITSWFLVFGFWFLVFGFLTSVSQPTAAIHWLFY